MDATAILARFLDEPRVARVRAVLDTYGHAAGGLLANGLAFSALFAAIPTMLLVLGLAGTIVNDPAIRTTVGDALIAAFPPLEDLIDARARRDHERRGRRLDPRRDRPRSGRSASSTARSMSRSRRIFSDTPERDIVRRTARGFLGRRDPGRADHRRSSSSRRSRAALDSATNLEIPFATSMAALAGSLPFLFAVAIVGRPRRLPHAATEGAGLAVGRSCRPSSSGWRSSS